MKGRRNSEVQRRKSEWLPEKPIELDSHRVEMLKILLKDMAQAGRVRWNLDWTYRKK